MTPRRAAQWAWALTAWANHAFITTVLVGLFPIFFDKYWAAGLPGTTSTFYLGLTNSSASLLVMLAGALARGAGRPARAQAPLVRLLHRCSARPPRRCWPRWRGHWGLALLLFGLGSLGFWAGSSFQDALMMQVAERAESNRVSALGFALGYLGGGLLFLLNVLLVLYPAWFHLADATAAMRVAFVDVAVWWIVFSLPMFRHVASRRPPPSRPAGASSGAPCARCCAIGRC